MSNLHVLFPDQLSLSLSCFDNLEKANDVVLLVEDFAECQRVKHHKKKLVFKLAAMRHFAQNLSSHGYEVSYFKLDDRDLKIIVMTCLLGLITYFAHGILNNYLDTDKASIPVWGFTAVLVSIEYYHLGNFKEKASE